MADVRVAAPRHGGIMGGDGARGRGVPLYVEAAAVSGGQASTFSLPTGMVTFLLSDVDGPARHGGSTPEALTAAIARYREVMDEAILGHEGVRPVGQRAGDGVIGAFSRPSDAVSAAVAAQRTFVAESWLRVRIGVHTGEAQVRDERSYFGLVLNRCARIRATGHGGQVLLSAATVALVVDRLPPGTTVDDVGWHRLRDLGPPQHLWQVVHDDLPSTFPPLRSLDTFRHNLPVQLTPLIGREDEVVDVCRRLEAERLVTLIGSAGVGKTRLALAVAAETVDDYPAGVWWVELAPLADAGEVGRAALAVLAAREVAGVPFAPQLAAALGDSGPSLVMLDNCEHLVITCAHLVADLLAANSAVSVVATSREPLGVPGEITWRVPSLSCPARERRVEVPTLSQFDAVVLFVERARRARPSFVVNDANAPAVTEICHRLDGIPLAIELAAARCRQMSAERIATELDDRFRLLTGGARTALARQQTLAASIDWSHDRLDVSEQLTFRRLGVFAGPFPLEAAENVVAAVGGVEQDAVFDLMSRLVDKSLVVADDGPGGASRYRLLESLRAYAVDRANTAGELVRSRQAHAAWWADWLEPRGAMPTDDLIGEFEEFHANLKAALDWSVDQPDVGLRLLRGVAVAWKDIGRAGDALAAADRLLTRDNAERHGDAWLAAAWLASNLYFQARGPRECSRLLEQVETVAAERGDELYLGLARWPKQTGTYSASLRELARKRGNVYLEAWLPIIRAIHLAEDEPTAAEPIREEAHAAALASGMHSLRCMASVAGAEAASSVGDLRRAIDLSRDALEGRFSSWRLDAVRIMSFAALLAVDEPASQFAKEAAERAQRFAPGLAGWIYNAQHRLELLQGHPSIVPPHLRAAPPSNGTLWVVSREVIDAGAADIALECTRAEARPPPHAQAVLAAIEAEATGDENRWHDALAIALQQGLRLIAVDALEGLAVAAARAESWSECLRLLAGAERLRDETGYRWRFGCEQLSVTNARTDAAAALGEAAESAASNEGRELDWREAAAYARRARGERKRPNHGWTSLTPTEQRVVALVADGLTNPQIAERLFMGRATVKTHLEHVFVKLGVRTRAELAAHAARRARP